MEVATWSYPQHMNVNMDVNMDVNMGHFSAFRIQRLSKYN